MVARTSKPSAFHRVTAAILVSTTALNTIAETRRVSPFQNVLAKCPATPRRT
jgi:hypothetical protein